MQRCGCCKLNDIKVTIKVQPDAFWDKLMVTGLVGLARKRLFAKECLLT